MHPDCHEPENIQPLNYRKGKAPVPQIADTDEESNCTQRQRTGPLEVPEEDDDIFAQLEQHEAEMYPDAAAEEGGLDTMDAVAITNNVFSFAPVDLPLASRTCVHPATTQKQSRTLQPIVNLSNQTASSEAPHRNPISHKRTLKQGPRSSSPSQHLSSLTEFPQQSSPGVNHCSVVPPTTNPTITALHPSQDCTPLTSSPHQQFPPAPFSQNTSRLPDNSLPSSETEAPSDLVPIVADNTTRQWNTKVKATDYEEEFQSTILLACKYYRVILCTEDAFPVEIDADHFAWQAWQLACREHEVQYTADHVIYKVIKYRGSQVCGEVKRNMRPLATSHFGFQASMSESDIADTKSYVMHLKSTNALVYKDHDSRTGLFQTPLLPRLIRDQWFHKPHMEGVSFHAYFNPIPFPLIALTFVAIKNCVDEWQTSHFTALSFSEKIYKNAYQEHLDALEKWQAHLKGGPILARLQQHLHDQSRVHSGATVMQTSRPSRITADDFEAAAMEADEEPDEYQNSLERDDE
ncbi:hypothetical protein K439DRAFT_1615265 [Ramaria rubella]|nr:hypothetical protein K439DRAFT_1615265 [Ramaria rubella]